MSDYIKREECAKLLEQYCLPYEGESVSEGLPEVLRRAARLLRAPQPESEPASVTEPDGCPTEGAVLKRFWREHQPRPVSEEREECARMCEAAGHDERLADGALYLRAARLLRAPQQQAELVAWRWRPLGSLLWMYDPTPAWLDTQTGIEKQPLYVAPPPDKPCPHVRTSGTTSWCELARRDAEDAARLDWCMLNIGGRAWREVGVYYAGGCDRAAIDVAIKQEQTPGWFDPNSHGRGGI